MLRLIINLSLLLQAIGQVREEVDWNTCIDKCGESYMPGRPCYCNQACSQYENCCYDYIMLCQPEMATNDTWTNYNGHSYKYFSGGTLNAGQANEQCQRDGGLLVSINTREEFNFVSNEVLKKRTLSAFIGGSDLINEGTWVWSDGTPVPLPGSPWHAWFDGEPDNQGGAEHCNVITNYMFWAIRKRLIDRYVWRDYSCRFNPSNEIQGYICERTLLCEDVKCQNGGRCVYIPGPEEFECNCPHPFVGDRCQYEEKEGVEWTICGETELTASSGVIHSPLYPKQYPANVRCRWTLYVPENRTISLSIETFNIEASKHCWSDHLKAFETNGGTESSILFGPLCGSLSDPTNELVRQTYISSASEIVVEFETDEDVSLNGFSLTYEQSECGQGSGESGCGIPKFYTSTCGEIKLHQKSQNTGHTCEFQIHVDEQFRIKLSIVKFETLDTGIECNGGSLAIYDGPSNTHNILQHICGKWSNETLLSSGNTMFMRLSDLSLRNGDIIHLHYETIDDDAVMNKDERYLNGKSGRFEFGENVIYNPQEEQRVFKWFIEVPIGYIIQLRLDFTLSMNSSLTIFIGNEVTLQPLKLWTDDAQYNELLEVPYFCALIELSEAAFSGAPTNLQAFFEASEWSMEESGCYRPFFYTHDMGSYATENNLVSAMSPLVIMASDDSRHGYESGLYCQWHIKSDQAKSLSIELLDFNIYPKASNCEKDGFLALSPDRNDVVFGPFCGYESIQGMKLATEHDELIFVLYSNPSGHFRNDGKLRALVFVDETGNETDCPIMSMQDHSRVETLYTCGIILSPNFPGLVEPGLWFWTFTPPDDQTIYFDVTLFYVRGPGVKDPLCEQNFKIIEVPKDAQELRQYEADLLTLCGDTELFQPAGKFKLPPEQKLGIQLQIRDNLLPQRWEFKLYFELKKFPSPSIHPETGACPDNYSEWRNYCYGHHQWILRHYAPEEHDFLTTWQAALERCEMENGTLISIYDDEEAYFIKHTLATEWFWDKAAPLAVNHRLIFLGLHNRQQNYEWTTGVNLGYSDWYRPKPGWKQPPVFEDSFLPEIVDFDLKQPTADSSTLCSGFLYTSPHESLNWIKIPCDYPLFRAGVICKQPVSEDLQRNENITEDFVTMNQGELDTTKEYGLVLSKYNGCEKGWFMLEDNCYQLYSNYIHNNESNDVIPTILHLDDAVLFCERNNATIPKLPKSYSELSFDRLLKLWNHTDIIGNILAGYDGHTNCSYIQALREDSFDAAINYDKVIAECSINNTVVTSVLCMKAAAEHKEECRENEFRCRNGMCISSDFVCDSVNDCKDNSDELKCECTDAYYRCNNGECISISLRCDFIEHCLDGSDETHCALAPCGQSEFHCNNGQCIDADKTCDRQPDCVDGSDEDAVQCAGHCDGFQCYSGLCLDGSLMHDGMTDCPGQTAEDEADTSSELLTLFGVYYDVAQENSTNIYGCKEGGTFTNCNQGESPCYDRSEICVYDTIMKDATRDYRTMKSCRNGAHLHKACADVECPGLYHCRGSYCIPPEKVCDQRIDCPERDDEIDCDNYVCPGMFRCKATTMCLPHAKVCDGTVDCLMHGEDEKYCDYKDVICDDCICTGHIAYCEDSRLSALPENPTNKKRDLRAIFGSSNSITELTVMTFKGLHWLTRLDLSYNKISKLENDVFEDLRNLIDLDLSHNQISDLQRRSFNGLIHLKVLNLNNNKLKEMYQTQVAPLVSIAHLMITNNDLRDVKKKTFDELSTLEILNSDDFKICCVAPNVDICTPEADEFSSCEDLMSNYLLQVCIWILGIIALIGNAFVVAWRIKSDTKKASSIFVINLGCSDFLMGVYLVIIASVDTHYRGRYIEHSDSWRESWLCQLAGILATISSETSVFMLTTMTVERCVTVMNPLKAGHLTASRAKAIACVGWIVCLFLSILPLTELDAFGDAFYGRTGVCLPFIVSNEQLPGWEYSAFIFLCLNLVSFIIIVFGYAMIFGTVKSNLETIGKSANNVVDEYALAKKLALIVGSDFVCWVPIILIGFAALAGATIDPEVSAWIAVFVLPLNSALNPIIYTLSAIDCGRAKRRRRALYGNSTDYSQTVSTVVTRANTIAKKVTMQDTNLDKPNMNPAALENTHA